VVDRLEAGNFTIRVEHRYLKSAANRLVVGMFFSSLLLASALLIVRSVRPLLFGLSVAGVLGFVVAIAFGCRMVWINRDRAVSGRDADWD